MLKWSKDKKEEQPVNWPKYAEHLEQCVEDVRRVASDAHRGLVQNVLVSKKNKKYPEYTLSTVLKESVDKSSADDRLFIYVTREASKALSILSSYHRDHENKVERQIVDPLNRLAEETCVNITKGRRNLQKCLTDVRNARGQLQKTMQCIQTNTTSVYPGSCNPSVTIDAVNRISQAQHQLEEKESELESSEEQLLRDLYSFAAEEENHSRLLLQYFQLQEAYLSDSLQLVQKVIADMSQTIRQQKRLTTFGRHLPDHLAETKRSIAYVLDVCINYLDQESIMQEEGLFRKSGSQKRTDLLVKALNIMQIDEHLLRKCDCAVVAGALKQYLLSLPEPLITYEFADQWATASKKANSITVNMQLIQSCLEQMPKEFRLNLGYLICFLHKLSNHSNVNKMTSDNLSIVIAPNIYRLSTSHMNNNTGNIVNGASLMRPVDDVVKSLDFLQNNGPGIHLVDILIQNAEQLFGQEQASFRLTHIQPHFGTKIYSYHSSVGSLSSSKLSHSGVSSSHGSDNSPAVSNEQASQNINQSATLKKPTGTDHHDPNCHITQSAVASRISISGTTPILQRKKTAAPKPPIPLYSTSSSTTHVNNSNSLKTEDSSVNDTENKNEDSDNTNSCSSNDTTSEGTIHPLPTHHHESLPQLINGSARSTESTTNTNHKLSLPIHMTTSVSLSSNDLKLSKDAPPKRPPPPDVNLKQNNAVLESDTDSVTVM
ncbi:SH3 domain-binding protein 1 [Schistosoma japonicum]|nr:SH3 domain-binding protein 1 [Schistosoma japonicum]KAH8863498.1 SH3 domain-binding protein 1 [Schistosoma japonicum]